MQTTKRNYLRMIDDSHIADTDEGVTIALELWHVFIEPMTRTLKSISDPNVKEPQKQAEAVLRKLALWEQ